MSPSPEEQKDREPFWRSRPVLFAVALLALVNVIILVVVDTGGDLLGLNGVHKTIVAAFGWSVVFLLWGILNRNRHGGFAVFVGLIALTTAIGFAAMYAANPSRFSAIE